MSNSKPLNIEIKELCSSGSFADVYKGNLLRGTSNEAIAIKVLKEKWLQDQDQLHRFWDEAELIKKLNHPHIIRVEGVFELNGLPSILMEFVDGLDLKRLIEHPNFQFSPKSAFEIAATIARTINDVYNHSTNALGHSMAVLHRDIKPSNIMLNRNGLVRVLDFGASRYNDTDRLGRTSVYEPGSLKYSPPERRLGSPGTHSGDIFALGLVLIEMLAGNILPIPPLDPMEYHNYIHTHVHSLNLGMPNDDWIASARTTLLRMCSFDSKQHLNAEQAVHMLTPYAQNASGLSMSQVITQQLTRIPIRYQQGELSSQRLQIHLIRSLYREPEESSVSMPITPAESSVPKLAPVSSDVRHQFWKIFGIYASSVCCGLLLLSFVAMTIFTESSNASENQFNISISKENISIMEILDREENVLLKLRPSKNKEELQLKEGRYIIRIRVNKFSKENETFQFSVQEDATLHCESTNEKSRCALDGSTL